uniref:DNA-directed RNA polymerases II and V subunit 8A-like n=1 Tax=Erigeron canadensis TaxID=72917 RepID=UPI001CB93CCE|nr:DNA-directed RNA polymerases II and V subunit 8A-like [Erigeron canadensis]XP_043610811.1 DNA-directed RNA polymerases II and V subunit 8A-like [Erigeron canadensis]
MVNPHFDDTIKVIGLDADGKKYDKVSRVQARAEESGMHIVLDVNSQLYPMRAGENYRMVLSQTLNEDGSAATTNSDGNKKSLADRFEYVMHGLLYKISDDKNQQSGQVEVAVYISFGGLQLLMKGAPEKMAKFKVDQRLFLLLLKE